MRDFVAHVRRHLPRRDVPAHRYDEIVEELASELEARYSALIQRGSTDDEAWSDILQQVPSWSELTQELGASGDRRWTLEHPLRVHVLLAAERWVRELRHGLRSLRHDFGYTVTAILVLAVGLGGHAAIAAGVNALLLHPVRTPEPERVLLMANQYPRVEARRGILSATPDYDDRLRHVAAFEEQALYNYYAATISVGGLPTVMRGMVATPSLFRLLRVHPIVGRTFQTMKARSAMKREWSSRRGSGGNASVAIPRSLVARSFCQDENLRLSESCRVTSCSAILARVSGCLSH